MEDIRDFPELLTSRVHSLMSSIQPGSNFERDDPVCHDRLVFDANGRPHAAMARCEAWHGLSGRLSWFTLESQLPHVSTIAACFGLPTLSRRAPVLTLNLNFKPQFGSVGCIAGFRSHDRSQAFEMAGCLQPPPATPIADVEIPADFFGVRAIYRASPVFVDWAISSWEALIAVWLARCGLPHTGDRGSLVDGAKLYGPYVDGIKKLHAHGGVFDAIFGEGWVESAFSRVVFPDEEDSEPK